MDACGADEIGVATAKKMHDFRLVLWTNHGIYGARKSLDETFGLIEMVEKAATIYNIIGERKILNNISGENLKKLVKIFHLEEKVRLDFFDK